MFYLIPLSLSLASRRLCPVLPKTNGCPNGFPAIQAILKSSQIPETALFTAFVPRSAVLPAGSIQQFHHDLLHPRGFEGGHGTVPILRQAFWDTATRIYQDATEKWIPAIKHGGIPGKLWEIPKLNGSLVLWEHINAGIFQH